jgi:DNA-binding MarR family transcriptional regulator
VEYLDVAQHGMTVDLHCESAGARGEGPGHIPVARRERKAAGTLSLLQLVAGRQSLRPSEIAEVHGVHPSLVTRQVRELEDAGLFQVAADPADGRSCLLTLTPAGAGELQRLTQAGLDRFALFVADWQPSDVRILTALLDKPRNSITAVAAQEQQRPAGRLWAGTSRQD